LLGFIISEHSDAGNNCEHIPAERRKFLRRAGQMPNDRMFLASHFSYDVEYGGAR
jgi:hypothetical protein